MDKSPFKNRKMVKEMIDLPTVINYSFVGLASPEYHAKLEKIVMRIAGDENIRKRSFKESARGNYTAYRYRIYHDDFETIEELYKAVSELEGTKFLV